MPPTKPEPRHPTKPSPISQKHTGEPADEPTMGTKLPFPAGRRAHPTPDPSRPRTAFVLSGGGNQGVSQVGMLRALLERGIVPDVVIGTSAGALNGAAVAYAPNLTGVAQLAAVWEQLQTDHVFPGGRIHRAWNVVRRGTHLFGNEGLAALIHHSSPARSFSDLEIPFRVIATDLDTGEEVVLARGPLKPALLASAALPGVFPIIVHDGRRLVDGGVVNNVPLWHALSGPVDRIFVLNVSAGAGEHAVRSPLDVVMTSFMHARNQRYELERRQAIDHVDIIDLPRPRDARDLFDFSGARELMESAYTLSMETLDEYERDIDSARELAVAAAAADEAAVREQRRRFRLRRGA
jgi:NTE family protein